MSKIVFLVASNGKNLELAESLVNYAKEVELESEIIKLTELDLPLYHTNEEEKNGVPVAAVELANTIKASRSLVVVAPEYNGLIPPSLNNAIAWVSRSSEDWRSAFNGRTVGIATHSGGGGIHALIAMRQQLSYLGANVLGRQVQTNFSKPLGEKTAKAFISAL